tara:strand:+ start:1504 stop:2115 length:612 start_codon:yes stop_codon:yes gene_type:complete
LKIDKKKFIYLISPNKISGKFYQNLDKILVTGKVGFFQMRLKKYTLKQKISIGKKIKKICKKNSVKFLINDDPFLAKIINADGCHLGQKDMDIIEARKIIPNKIIGVTCHNSLKLAKIALKNKANYLAFGAFFSTKTKKVKYKARIKILNEVKKITKTPLVAIGGINHINYKKLLLNNSDLLAMSSYVWKNKRFKPLEAVEKL